MRRVDEFGRAYAGSQLQIQTYVNRRQDELAAAVCEAFPELASNRASFLWVSPLEHERFVEYQDGEFLAALDLTQLAGQLSEFWPQGGPKWDALARVRCNRGEPPGVLLVEAKSYPGEMYSDGCRASELSSRRIFASLESAREWFGAVRADWTGPLYQYANRLAHLYFLRKICGIPTWFVNVCFAADPHRPTPRCNWKPALQAAKAALGFSFGEIPFCADVILDAAGRELFQAAPNTMAFATGATRVVEAGKEWRFLKDDRFNRHQFLAFANWRGSSSLRYFDAESGSQLGEPRYGRRLPYQVAFARELEASVPVNGPGSVSNEWIAPDDLRSIRLQVGLSGVIQSRLDCDRRSSILAGVDAIVDKDLRIQHIGSTSPHYRHLGAYRAIACSRALDGDALIETMYERIANNWPGTPCRSGENWRWIKKTYISEENSSLEKRFEKALVDACGEWCNMIPVASGVLPDVEEGGRRIDLARQCDSGWFEFVELKLGPICNTPLHASIEILGYGLIYVFSRMNREQLGYDSKNILLSAERISLIALAPAASYIYGSLAHFESEINRGLKTLVSKQSLDPLRIDFRFEQFPADLDANSACGSPREAMARRQRVYPAP